MSDYHVSNMNRDQVGTAIDWANRQGWNCGMNDASCFYQADPQGFFYGQLDGEIISVASAVRYDDSFAFFGLYIVDEPYRGQGYGMEMTQARLAYTEGCNRGLDGVLENVDMYAQIGFQFAYTNCRYHLEELAERFMPHPHVVTVDRVPFEQVLRYDRRCFPAPREAFLSAWIDQPQAQALAWVDDDKLKGFAVMRRCQSGYKIGPLFADDAEVADGLFQSLCAGVSEGPVILDIPDVNAAARDLVEKYHMNLVFETARMYTKNQPNIDLQRVFGVTTFELG